MSEEYKIKVNASFNDTDGEFNIKIPLHEIIDEMTDEQKLELAGHVTWGAIFKEAKSRLIDMAQGFSTEDWKDKIEFISAVEDRLISGYKWGMLRELRRVANSIASHKEIYYAMTGDKQHGEFFRQWLKENELDSRFGDYETVEDFKGFVDEWFVKLAAGKVTSDE